MIYTVTLNPSVDYIVEVDGFQLGELNRTKKETKFPGGKGINVSRVLKQTGVASIALGFNGGFTGKYIDEYLQSEDIITDFVKVKEETRINIKLKTGIETEINASGPNILNQNVKDLKEKLKRLTTGDILVLAGSVPKSLPETIYEDLAKICKENGAEFVVDAEGELLKKVLSYQPFLIKPNHHELGDLFGITVKNFKDVIPLGKKLIQMGAKNVIVSLAGDGAVFINEKTSLIANVPIGEVKNSVGAGDSMVAGFLSKYQQTKDFTKAFHYSVAAGSATAFSLGLCTKEKIEELQKQIKIRPI